MQSSCEGNSESGCSLTGNVPPSLLELSEDLRKLYETHVNHDLSILLPDSTILCHRVILSARSKWFACWNEKSKTESLANFRINESKQIMNALLIFMYTGNLCLVQSLRVPLLDLREAAAQYGLDRLKNLLTKIIKSEEKPCVKKSREFIWKVNVTDLKSLDLLCPYLIDFSLYGTDKWYLKMRPINCGQSKNIGIYVKKVTAEQSSSKSVIHIVNFEMHILDVCGKKQRSFYDLHIFKKDGECRMTEYLSLSRLMENAKTVLPNGVLSLFFRLTFSSEDSALQPTFQITHEIENDVTNEFHALSRDMYKLLRDEKFSDVSILVKGSPILKVHASIIYVRTLIPTPLNGKLMDLGYFGSYVWKSFIYYLYTGQTRYLEDHMREIYVAASKQHLSKMQKKYSNILANYLTTGNVFDILSDAKAFGDVELVQSGLLFIAENDIIDDMMWNMFSSSHPNCVRNVLCQTRHKKPMIV